MHYSQRRAIPRLCSMRRLPGWVVGYVGEIAQILLVPRSYRDSDHCLADAAISSSSQTLEELASGTSSQFSPVNDASSKDYALSLSPPKDTFVVLRFHFCPSKTNTQQRYVFRGLEVRASRSLASVKNATCAFEGCAITPCIKVLSAMQRENKKAREELDRKRRAEWVRRRQLDDPQLAM